MKVSSIVILLVFLCGIETFSQTKILSLERGGVFEIPEVGAVIIKKDNQFVVEHIMPTERRIKGYENIDLQREDKVIMMNGKKIKDIEELHKSYGGLKTGEELKLGIKRGEQMFIVSIQKADPKDLPEIKRVVIDDSKGDIKLLVGLGLVLKQKDKTVVLDKMLRNDIESINKSGIEAGDILSSLNGKNISSIPQLRGIYDIIKAGKEIELTFLSKGKEKSLKIKKPADKGNVIIKTDANRK